MRRLVVVLSLVVPVFVAACGGEPSAPASPSDQPADAAMGRTAGRVDVIMTGLNSPRGMAWGPDGALYVAESGLATATDLCAPVARGSNCWSGSGSISRYAHGRQERVVSGLPSVFNATVNDIVGPHDIEFRPHGLPRALVSIGWGGDPDARAALGDKAEGLGSVVQLAKRPWQRWRPSAHRDADDDDDDRGWEAGVRWRVFADIAAFERSANPGGGAFDSNPYGFLFERGRAYVTDAGGNSLVEARRGNVSLVATFPATPVPPGPFNPPFAQFEAVPTEVKRGPDGALYVSVLTGAPFLPGAAMIYRVAPGEAPVPYVTGLTQVVDFDFDGNALVALQHGAAPFFGGPGTIVRVAEDGTRETITTPMPLTRPTAVLVGRHGEIYVTNRGNEALVGEVWRIRR